MKILLLNSDVDNFTITFIVVITALPFIFKWAWLRLKSKTGNITFFLYDEVEYRFDNYTFNFKNGNSKVEAFGIKTKIIAAFISSIMVVTPLYEFIETLRPQIEFWGFTCLL
ncbi:hypothetical protein [uncultured Winogradskyella sp.]|uniref:hypothetical protein n=1 Tax=uncultured Winogradskyella sp. TaxID=395353 RepID=UPI002633CE92|nr:hypothetical protein [uncultured Winogradskyella sp.]